MPSDEAPPVDGPYKLIGTASALSQAIAFTAVGALALENLPFGIVAGAISGVGSYLFMPWFLRLSAAQEESSEGRSFADIIEQTPGRPKRKLFGLGLEIGAIAMVAIGFTLDEPDVISGAAGGMATALFVYLFASVGLDRLVLADD